MGNRRVVVTGRGVVSPIGTGIDAFRAALEAGRSGDGPIRSFDAAGFPVRIAYEVKDFNAREARARLMDPFIQYALAATHEAVENAGAVLGRIDPYRIGIAVSSSKGGVRTIERFRERFEKKPTALLGARIYTNAVPNFAAQWIARRYKISGPAVCYVAACATGTIAILEGARMVADGTVDYCLAGSSDASITPLMLAAYRNMKALSPEPMRPFDRARRGFGVGEGAGVVFLETYESARARKARIYGEILGGHATNDASHAIHFDPKGSGLADAIRTALKKSGLAPGEIDYINLHGTGTRDGDIYETAQIKQAFGRKAGAISLSSTKSMTGHLLGASGAVEAVACLCAMEGGWVPPTVRLENSDPACDLDYTPLKAVKKNVRHVLSLSMGFGGNLAVLAMTKGN